MTVWCDYLGGRLVRTIPNGTYPAGAGSGDRPRLAAETPSAPSKIGANATIGQSLFRWVR